MGMSVGGRTDGEPEVMVEMNTTPLIDVMLVLLIMLIITIPIQLHAVNLNLPVGVPPTQSEPPPKIQIDIDAESKIYWQGEVLADGTALAERMREVAALPVQPDIHLRPNKKARYEVVAAVLAATKNLGLTKIAVIGSEQFIE